MNRLNRLFFYSTLLAVVFLTLLSLCPKTKSIRIELGSSVKIETKP
jgi:hypothetical protein